MMNNRTVGTGGRMVIVAVAAVGAAVGACGGGPDEEPPPPEPVGASATPDELVPADYAPDPTGRVQLPLDVYRDRLVTANGGMTAEAVECFVQAGVDADKVGVQPGRAEQNDRRYSVADESIASRYGYHAPEVQDPRDALLDAADEDQLVAASECMARLPEPSDEVLEGEQLISDIQSDAWWAAQEDPQVKKAFAAWSACMAKAGYDYAHPMDANDDPQWVTRKATAAEITVAKVDVRCKKQTDLIRIWSSVEAEQQKKRIEKHESELKTYRKALAH